MRQTRSNRAASSKSKQEELEAEKRARRAEKLQALTSEAELKSTAKKPLNDPQCFMSADEIDMQSQLFENREMSRTRKEFKQHLIGRLKMHSKMRKFLEEAGKIELFHHEKDPLYLINLIEKEDYENLSAGLIHVLLVLIDRAFIRPSRAGVQGRVFNAAYIEEQHGDLDNTRKSLLNFLGDKDSRQSSAEKRMPHASKKRSPETGNSKNLPPYQAKPTRPTSTPIVIGRATTTKARADTETMQQQPSSNTNTQHRVVKKEQEADLYNLTEEENSREEKGGSCSENEKSKENSDKGSKNDVDSQEVVTDRDRGSYGEEEANEDEDVDEGSEEEDQHNQEDQYGVTENEPYNLAQERINQKEYYQTPMRDITEHSNSQEYESTEKYRGHDDQNLDTAALIQAVKDTRKHKTIGISKSTRQMLSNSGNDIDLDDLTESNSQIENITSQRDKELSNNMQRHLEDSMFKKKNTKSDVLLNNRVADDTSSSQVEKSADKKISNAESFGKRSYDSHSQVNDKKSESENPTFRLNVKESSPDGSRDYHKQSDQDSDFIQHDVIDYEHRSGAESPTFGKPIVGSKGKASVLTLGNKSDNSISENSKNIFRNNSNNLKKTSSGTEVNFAEQDDSRSLSNVDLKKDTASPSNPGYNSIRSKVPNSPCQHGKIAPLSKPLGNLTSIDTSMKQPNMSPRPYSRNSKDQNSDQMFTFNDFTNTPKGDQTSDHGADTSGPLFQSTKKKTRNSSIDETSRQDRSGKGRHTPNKSSIDSGSDRVDVDIVTNEVQGEFKIMEGISSQPSSSRRDIDVVDDNLENQGEKVNTQKGSKAGQVKTKPPLGRHTSTASSRIKNLSLQKTGPLSSTAKGSGLVAQKDAIFSKKSVAKTLDASADNTKTSFLSKLDKSDRKDINNSIGDSKDRSMRMKENSRSNKSPEGSTMFKTLDDDKPSHGVKADKNKNVRSSDSDRKKADDLYKKKLEELFGSQDQEVSGKGSAKKSISKQGSQQSSGSAKQDGDLKTSRTSLADSKKVSGSKIPGMPPRILDTKQIFGRNNSYAGKKQPASTDKRSSIATTSKIPGLKTIDKFDGPLFKTADNKDVRSIAQKVVRDTKKIEPDEKMRPPSVRDIMSNSKVDIATKDNKPATSVKSTQRKAGSTSDIFIFNSTKPGIVNQYTGSKPMKLPGNKKTSLDYSKGLSVRDPISSKKSLNDIFEKTPGLLSNKTKTAAEVSQPNKRPSIKNMTSGHQRNLSRDKESRNSISSHKSGKNQKDDQKQKMTDKMAKQSYNLIDLDRSKLNAGMAINDVSKIPNAHNETFEKDEDLSRLDKILKESFKETGMVNRYEPEDINDIDLEKSKQNDTFTTNTKAQGDTDSVQNKDNVTAKIGNKGSLKIDIGKAKKINTTLGKKNLETIPSKDTLKTESKSTPKNLASTTSLISKDGLNKEHSSSIKDKSGSKTQNNSTLHEPLLSTALTKGFGKKSETSTNTKQASKSTGKEKQSNTNLSESKNLDKFLHYKDMALQQDPQSTDRKKTSRKASSSKSLVPSDKKTARSKITESDKNKSDKQGPKITFKDTRPRETSGSLSKAGSLTSKPKSSSLAGIKKPTIKKDLGITSRAKLGDNIKPNKKSDSLSDKPTSGYGLRKDGLSSAGSIRKPEIGTQKITTQKIGAGLKPTSANSSNGLGFISLKKPKKLSRKSNDPRDSSASAISKPKSISSAALFKTAKPKAVNNSNQASASGLTSLKPPRAQSTTSLINSQSSVRKGINKPGSASNDLKQGLTSRSVSSMASKSKISSVNKLKVGTNIANKSSGLMSDSKIPKTQPMARLNKPAEGQLGRSTQKSSIASMQSDSSRQPSNKLSSSSQIKNKIGLNKVWSKDTGKPGALTKALQRLTGIDSSRSSKATANKPASSISKVNSIQKKSVSASSGRLGLNSAKRSSLVEIKKPKALNKSSVGPISKTKTPSSADPLFKNSLTTRQNMANTYRNKPDTSTMLDSSRPQTSKPSANRIDNAAMRSDAARRSDIKYRKDNDAAMDRKSRPASPAKDKNANAKMHRDSSATSSVSKIRPISALTDSKASSLTKPAKRLDSLSSINKDKLSGAKKASIGDDKRADKLKSSTNQKADKLAGNTGEVKTGQPIKNKNNLTAGSSASQSRVNSVATGNVGKNVSSTLKDPKKDNLTKINDSIGKNSVISPSRASSIATGEAVKNLKIDKKSKKTMPIESTKKDTDKAPITSASLGKLSTLVARKNLMNITSALKDSKKIQRAQPTKKTSDIVEYTSASQSRVSSVAPSKGIKNLAAAVKKSQKGQNDKKTDKISGLKSDSQSRISSVTNGKAVKNASSALKNTSKLNTSTKANIQSDKSKTALSNKKDIKSKDRAADMKNDESVAKKSISRDSSLLFSQVKKDVMNRSAVEHKQSTKTPSTKLNTSMKLKSGSLSLDKRSKSSSMLGLISDHASSTKHRADMAVKKPSAKHVIAEISSDDENSAIENVTVSHANEKVAAKKARSGSKADKSESKKSLKPKINKLDEFSKSAIQKKDETKEKKKTKKAAQVTKFSREESQSELEEINEQQLSGRRVKKTEEAKARVALDAKNKDKRSNTKSHAGIKSALRVDKSQGSKTEADTKAKNKGVRVATQFEGDDIASAGDKVGKSSIQKDKTGKSVGKDSKSEISKAKKTAQNTDEPVKDAIKHQTDKLKDTTKASSRAKPPSGKTKDIKTVVMPSGSDRDIRHVNSYKSNRIASKGIKDKPAHLDRPPKASSTLRPASAVKNRDIRRVSSALDKNRSTTVAKGRRQTDAVVIEPESEESVYDEQSEVIDEGQSAGEMEEANSNSILDYSSMLHRLKAFSHRQGAQPYQSARQSKKITQDIKQSLESFHCVHHPNDESRDKKSMIPSAKKSENYRFRTPELNRNMLEDMSAEQSILRLVSPKSPKSGFKNELINLSKSFGSANKKDYRLTTEDYSVLTAFCSNPNEPIEFSAHFTGTIGGKTKPWARRHFPQQDQTRSNY